MFDSRLKIASARLWLAPLAGLTDKAFRTICKKCGADVVVSEMISADGLINNFKKSIIYAEFDEMQRPFALQLFGSDPLIMARAAEIVLDRKPDMIDLNMGCPVKKVVARGAGSALMRKPEIAEKIVKEVKSVLSGSSISLTVKFRAGWDAFSINAIDFGKRLEAAGADAVCLHPRTRSQMFAGHSDWNLIKILKQSIGIPVIGNGDIQSGEDAMAMLKQTGCDDVMLGRGILGKPWLFAEIKSLLESADGQTISKQEKFHLISEHTKLAVERNGEERAVIEMRTHFNHYTKGFRNGASVRNYINRCFDLEDILSRLRELYLGQFGCGEEV